MDLLFVIILGGLWGSFANVCVYRLPMGKGVVSGRSFCPNCKKLITWKDNIPIISFLFLNGKCRSCRKKISFQYLIVELISIIYFLGIYYLFGITLGLFVTSGLLRFGPSFENIAWASLFFLAPLGCIYYPIDILPLSLQIVAKALPLVHIFEEMRNILIHDTINHYQILKAIFISFAYFMLGIVIFYLSYAGAKNRGTLINMGE